MEYLLLASAFAMIALLGAGALSTAPWVPTMRKLRLVVAEAVPASARVVYELGCGDGSVAFDIARARPAVRVIGYDVSLLPLIIGYFRSRRERDARARVSLRWGDLFGKNFSDADAIFAYLLPRAYRRLAKKFSRELKDDCAVFIEAWPFPGMEAEKVIRTPGMVPVYQYSGRQFRTPNI